MMFLLPKTNPSHFLFVKRHCLYICGKTILILAFGLHYYLFVPTHGYILIKRWPPQLIDISLTLKAQDMHYLSFCAKQHSGSVGGRGGSIREGWGCFRARLNFL